MNIHNPEWITYQQQLETGIKGALNWLQTELNKIRAGQASIGLVDGAKINAYGSSMPIHQLANISIPEPQLLLIKPYDPDVINDLIKGITRFNDQLNPVVDGKVIRIVIPLPSEESRKQAIKLIKGFLEKTKITIRNLRKQIQTKIKSAKYQEGLEQVLLQELEHLVKQANDQAEQMFSKKEKNLLTI